MPGSYVWLMTPVVDSAFGQVTCLSPKLDYDLFKSRDCILIILVALVPDLVYGS